MAREKAGGLGGSNKFDVIVLGVGSCGEDLSLQLIDAGLKVLGIEAHLVGGECPYYACLPSKVMIRSGNILKEALRVSAMSGHAEVTADWEKVAARVRETTGDWDDSFAVNRYHDRGGRLIKGYGKLIGPYTVSVDNEIFTARQGIVIATGTKPSIPEIPGLEEVKYLTTRDIIQLEKLPASMTIIGGGPVSCELGQVLARFGAEIKIIQHRDQLIPREEPEAAIIIEEVFKSEGIKVKTGAVAEKVGFRNGQISVFLSNGEEVISESLLIATGRVTDLSGLGLESVGLDSKAKFIDVDKRMRAAEGIWAMGDVTGKALLTSVADYQSAIIAADILGREHPPAQYHAIPRVIFTDPEVGAVGMTEATARDAGISVSVVLKQVPSTIRGWLHSSEQGIIKLIIDRDADILVGATAVGPHAGEMLGMLSLAVHARVPMEELRNMIYGFPTFCGGIGEAIGAYARGVTTVFDPTYSVSEGRRVE